MSSIGIMQPYFFPYGGYFSLISASDTFVFFDDVNYIKRGWINKNKLSDNIDIVVPLKKASINKKINEIEVLSENVWRRKLLNSLTHCYRKAPYFEIVYNLVESVIEIDHTSIAAMAIASIVKSSDYLGLNSQWEVASNCYPRTTILRSEKRLQAIALEKGCSHYYNLVGGMKIYSKEDFLNHGIYLNFITNESMKRVSIIDYMMQLPPLVIKKMIHEYRIL